MSNASSQFKPLPPFASHSVFNVHRMRCEAMNGLPYVYAQCLRTIREIEEDSARKSNYLSCRKAVACDSCIAMKMRSEERAKGEAIYLDFYNPADADQRALLREALGLRPGDDLDRAIDSYRRGWDAVEGRLRPAARVTPRVNTIANGNGAKKSAELVTDSISFNGDDDVLSALNKKVQASVDAHG